MRRHALVPADPGLLARMVVAAVVTPLIVLAGLAVVLLEAPLKVKVVVAIACMIGVAAMLKERGDQPNGTVLSESEAQGLHAIVERLCLLADLPKPAIVFEPEALPNSWVVGTRAGGYRLHLTKGLLLRLEPREVEAVIAHELAHVANRDATVMTVVGGPGAALLGGGTRVMRHGGIWFVSVGGLAAIGLGWLGSIGTRALSRYREFAADAGAVRLTGNPAALASALMAVSDGLAALPDRDLRAVAARDAFHLLPVARGGRGDWTPPLPATHPALRARIARLERLEARLQAAYGPAKRS
jgi:heat shock protein HtpX